MVEGLLRLILVVNPTSKDRQVEYVEYERGLIPLDAVAVVDALVDGRVSRLTFRTTDLKELAVRFACIASANGRTIQWTLRVVDLTDLKNVESVVGELIPRRQEEDVQVADEKSSQLVTT